MHQVRFAERIQVMDDQPAVDVVTLDPEVAAQISSDHVAPKKAPLSRGVKTLINPTVETERRCPDLPMQSQVPEPIFERWESGQLSIGPHPHRRPPTP